MKSALNGCSEEEFKSFLKKNPLAIPDGFKMLGSALQTKYILNEKVIAIKTTDGFGSQYEILI